MPAVAVFVVPAVPGPAAPAVAEPAVAPASEAAPADGLPAPLLVCPPPPLLAPLSELLAPHAEPTSAAATPVTRSHSLATLTSEKVRQSRAAVQVYAIRQQRYLGESLATLRSARPTRASAC